MNLGHEVEGSNQDGYDLTKQPDIAPETLSSLLTYRLHTQNQIFSTIGSQVLIIVNSNTTDSYSDQQSQLYLEEYKDLESSSIELPPHLYKLCTQTYFQMRRLGEDQSIIFNGLTNSGKTYSYTLALNQLLNLSNSNSKKGNKLCEQLPNLQVILESFTNCTTINNPNSSRVGMYQELQFNGRGKVVGVKSIPYSLEKSRVAQVPSNERTFHIFYQLFYGSDPTLKESLGFDITTNTDNFNYLMSTVNGPSQHDDKANFSRLDLSLKSLNFKSKLRLKLYQVVAAILHLLNLQFQKYEDEDTATITNHEELEWCASLLGVSKSDLESCLTCDTQLIGKDICTVFLDLNQTLYQRDTLANTLYSLLFNWLVEAINSRTCNEAPDNFIALLDPFAFQSYNTNYFEQFVQNYSAEKVNAFVMRQLMDPNHGFRRNLTEDGITLPSNQLNFDNVFINKLLVDQDFISKVDLICNENSNNKDDSKLLTSLNKEFGLSPYYKSTPNSDQFTLKHYCNQVEYSIQDFLVLNLDKVPTTFINTFQNSEQGFVKELFSSEALNINVHPKNSKTIVSANQKLPLRQPSTKRSGRTENKEKLCTSLNQLSQSLDEIFGSLKDTFNWYVFNLNIYNNETKNLDTNLVLEQVQMFNFSLLADTQNIDFSVQFKINEFVTRYSTLLQTNNYNPNDNGNITDLLESLSSYFGWNPGQDYVLGGMNIFLSVGTFKILENHLRKYIKNSKLEANNENVGGMGFNDTDSVYSEFVNNRGLDGNSNLPPLTGYGNYDPATEEDLDSSHNRSEKDDNIELKSLPKSGTKGKSTVEVMEVTFARKVWVRLTWLMTWWIPTACIAKCGMTRPDVQIAWREKVTICLLIGWSWIVILFVNIGLGLILCPPDKVWKPDEIRTLQGPTDLGVYMYGVVYDITDFSQQRHGKSINPAGVDPDTMVQFGGQDVSSSFPIPLTVSCPDYVTDSNFKLWTNLTDDTLTSQFFVHDSGPLTQYPTTAMKDPNWFFSTALPKLKKLKKGEVVYDFKDLSDYRKAGYKQWGVINDKVYDLTPYVQTQSDPRYASKTPGAPTANFLPNTILQIFSNDSPAKDADLTTLWNSKTGLSTSEKKAVMSCLDKAFYIGKLDPRSSLRCQLTNILLLVSSGIILLVTLVKFLAALQLTSRRQPMDYDKFVICQVPAYTEGEESIRRTLESLALLSYDDKHKLIFVIADGMIIGSGNDKPTPRIVLDVLGVDPNLDPEPFQFKSIGEGSKQLNMGKVYSGLYECEGRVVPYIVVAKVGKPSEKSRPGNRGKRDSQILLMNFLNRCHFDSPMTPLDLEIYHQLKNVIGVDPKFYEFILMVDADTEVEPDALTRLIAVMTRDNRIIGLCGETRLSNENQSITTMMQVYEYYISHHLAKAFESLFGAVTCLPGCFCMYRIRTNRGAPLIINNSVIKDYSENIVDTLHKKNLLHLGEDRYLTTLMLKHFPNYKMKFTPDAQCKTVAPDRFVVLLSQRRRWINSTIHNLFELIFLNEMCGFCCFSMRFVVFLDLVGTLILPATVIYLIYIIIAASTGFQYISFISIIIMCSAYILQALIFILKQKWEHIGWMVFYMLGMGLFNFYIPIYSYWHFDDFSWGNTRVIMGEGKKQVITDDDEGFDPKSIPMLTWAEHEQNMWENASAQTHQVPMDNKSIAGSMSVINSNNGLARPSNTYSMYEPNLTSNSRIHSPFPSNPTNIQMAMPSQVNPQSSYQNYSNNNGSYVNDYRTSNSQTHLLASPSQNNMNVRSSVYSQVAPSPSRPQSHIQPSQSQSRLSYQQNNDNSNNSLNNSGGVVSDEVIVGHVHRLLRSADLMTVTKKQIREQIQQIYPNYDMNLKKELISTSIDQFLQSQ